MGRSLLPMHGVLLPLFLTLIIQIQASMVVFTPPNLSYFFMNTHRAPFDDLRVRRAVNFAISRKWLVHLAGGVARGAAVLGDGQLRVDPRGVRAGEVVHRHAGEGIRAKDTNRPEIPPRIGRASARPR